MRKPIIMFYDLETTGTDWKKHSIHQIAGVIEVDGQVVETFDIRTQPHPKAIIDPAALAVSGLTPEQVQAYQPMADAHRQLVSILCKYIDRYDSKDKIFLSGFNIAGFDDFFLRAWFQQNGDQYFGSYFWNDQLDVRSLAAQYLLHRRHTMPDFKLMTVAKELGIEVDETKAHDGVYDIMITREVYMIAVGLELEFKPL
jgi:DNA polymerase-3 subunit epsilon